VSNEVNIAERGQEIALMNGTIALSPSHNDREIYKRILARLEELSRAEAQVRQLREAVKRLRVFASADEHAVAAIDFADTALAATEPKEARDATKEGI